MSNNAVRVIVSVIAIPALLAAAYYGKIYFFLLTLAVSVISYIEFSRMAEKKGMLPNMTIGIGAILLIFLNQYYALIDFYRFFIVILVLLVIIELFRNRGSAIMNLGGTLLGVLYFGLFGSALMSLREFYPDIGSLYFRGGFLIITIFASIWICDSAAYYGGTAFGKHKLFPRVSPNKSWEGAIFGFVFAVLTVIAARYLVLDFLSWKTVIAIGLVTGIIGQTGDLVESLMKRDAGIKDSSGIIPGHGGIFDRFDSLLLTAPVVYLILRFVR